MMHPLNLRCPNASGPLESPPANTRVGTEAIRRGGILLGAARLAAQCEAPWQSTAPTLHDLQPRDVFRELLTEKHIEGDELTAMFDELLALKEAKSTPSDQTRMQR